jgi:hypothetical protein
MKHFLDTNLVSEPITAHQAAPAQARIALSEDQSTGTLVGPDQGQRPLPMRVKFSEDVVPLTDRKRNPGRVSKHAAQTR